MIRSFSLGRMVVGLAAGTSCQPAMAAGPATRPNILLILADDLGYGDLGCFGSAKIKTPRLDQMATEGRRFTSFYVQSVCGPSRTALLTGCCPLRVATWKNQIEIMPRVHPKEITIAEVLKTAGYTSMAIGKWHLAGHSQTAYTRELLPTRQGFDTYFGTPSSNDGVVNLLRDETTIERNADMSKLTGRYTDEAIEFIRKNKARPFFVYLAHTMPHTKLAVSDQFRAKSAYGLFGDAVEELDWNVGRLLDVLRSEGIAENTLVIFTSDNGPWFLNRPLLAPDDQRMRDAKGALIYPFNQRDERGSHGGSAGALRGAKTSGWEGGVRVPCLMRFPGRVPAKSECTELATSLDLLPTFARLAGAAVPQDRVIDGHDVTSLIMGEPGAISPTAAFYYYQRTRLIAVRAGQWKLHLPRPEDTLWAIYSTPADGAEIRQPLLFDLAADVAERSDVAAQHPDVVRRLLARADQAREDIGDFDRIGRGARFFDPDPRRPDLTAATASGDRLQH